jgi:hypothetical protein
LDTNFFAFFIFDISVKVVDESFRLFNIFFCLDKVQFHLYIINNKRIQKILCYEFGFKGMKLKNPQHLKPNFYGFMAISLDFQTQIQT